MKHDPPEETTAAHTVIPVIEEVPVVGKRTTTTGRLRVEKSVSERDVLVDEPLLQRDVHVERIPIGREVTSAEELPVIRYDGDTVIIPVLREEAVLVKRVVLTEEIRITRVTRRMRHAQKVTLRAEQVSVVHQGHVSTAVPERGGPPAIPEASELTRRSGMENQTVVAAFDRPSQAQDALDALLEGGFSRSQARLASAEGDLYSDTRTDTAERRAPEHMTLGQKIAHFFGLDDDDDTTSTYSEVMRRGSSVVAVDTATEDEAQRATTILSRFEPIDMDQRVSEWRAAGWQPEATERDRASRSNEQTTIPVVEEQLQVGKRVVRNGGVRVYSRTREIPVEERVELREERATVSRRPTDRPVTDQDRPFEDKSFEVLESREEPVVGKTARVVEEVVVGKETRRREEKVRDSVRKTEVDVQQAAEQPRSDRQRD